MPRASSFTFASYDIDAAHSTVSFSYRVEFQSGRVRTYTDRLYFEDVPPEAWGKVSPDILERTLQSLLLIIGITYWCVFPTPNMHIEGFALTKEQARFWDTLYLNGLGEFFFDMQLDFRNLIAFPHDPNLDVAVRPTTGSDHKTRDGARSLVSNGGGKDTILTAEMLKASNAAFDFFSFAPTPAQERIAAIVGAKNIRVTRRRDLRVTAFKEIFGISNAYPSVSMFTFVAVLLSELLGYNSIIFSNEQSADFGNLTYLGLPVNHQWCKSSEAEKLINDYIGRFISPDILTRSLLRKYRELEIVGLFVQYPNYFRQVTSCNAYFWLPRWEQRMRSTAYWCGRCPKCVFLFACFSAFLSKKEVTDIFGADLYAKTRLLPLFARILGIEGFKPLDCVGEPEEMILAMRRAVKGNEYAGEPAIQLFEKHFSLQ